MSRHDLSEGEWLIIQPLLPSKVRGVKRVDDRRVLNGILWRLRTGSPWRDIPERYDPYTTCVNRFNRWRKAGIWQRLIEGVSKGYDGRIQMIDSTVVRVHQHGAQGKKKDILSCCMGRSREGLTTKIHALVDLTGMPICLKLTAGQAHDGRSSHGMYDSVVKGTVLLADSAYDSDALRDDLEKRGAVANIKPMPNRKKYLYFDKALYKLRNIIERFFNKIK